MSAKHNLPNEKEPLNFRDLILGIRQLEINPGTPVMVHANFERFDSVRGGAETVIGVLLSSFSCVLMPAFTFQTMVVPGVGPEDNAIVYGTQVDQNLRAQFFQRDIPVDPQLGELSEAFRNHPKAERSSHPILSFCGLNTRQILASQSLAEPFAPVGSLADLGGWVLLLGADHSANVSIHWAERLAGRKQFIRWALTSSGVVECPGFPGCSCGFNALSERLGGVTRSGSVKDVHIHAFPVREMVDIARRWIEEDPGALLCEASDCDYCRLVRIGR